MENRARKMRNESKILETGNRDMEERLREIKELFEREQVKREKEALIWSSAGDGKRRKQQLDQQSRKILGKGFQTTQKPKFKVLKDEPLNLPERQTNRDLNKFISNQRNRIDDSKNRKTKSKSAKANLRVPSVSPPVPKPPEIEEYALLSDLAGSEIFELPLEAQGHLTLQVVRAVSSSRTIGIYAIRDGRKRLILADENGLIPRPSGGWNNITFFPLVPPRSSRPSTASREMAVYREPTPPMVGQSLLDGSYDEEKNEKEFKAAVQKFRQQNKQQQQATMSEVTITDDVDMGMETKLAKIGEMFEARTNLTVMERILLQKSKSENFEQNLETVEIPEKTDEELEMDEERNQFREMLIGGETKTEMENEVQENWTVPDKWNNSNIPTIHQTPHTDENPVNMELAPMWIPTPQIEAEPDGDGSGEIPEGYEPAGDIYQEHIRTVYDDGTVVNNIITVETTGAEDSGSDGEWVQCENSAQAWSGYDSDDDLDLGTDSEFKREAMRIIDEHARRYQEECGTASEIPPPGGERPDSALNRPASRASVITDADLENDFELTERLTQMEAKFYPSDDYE